MADSEILSPMNILKNSLILVNVEEALQDIIVVTYTHEGRIFQGVLLDTTKRTLPCGITPPVASAAPQLADTQEDDKLFSLSQRFTYFQDKPIRSADHLNHNQFLLKRPIRPPARYRNANVRATPVRLRPRQVLCSKCRGICNENSENVDVSQRSKCPENSISTRSVNSRSVGSSSELASSKSPRPLFSENHRDNQPKCMSPTKDAKLSPSLIPKISRLQPTEISNALIGNTNKLNIVGNYWMSPSRPSDETDLNGLDEKDENDGKLYCLPVHKVLVQDTLDEASLGQVDPLGDDVCVLSGAEEPSGGMVLRKKKSVGSMEDLWDESVFEECGGGGGAGAKKARAARTTPVIKISFGSRGEGTVMKIPSKLRECSESDTDDRAHRNTRDASAKAAKKALKRAKREARRKMLGGASPARSFGGMSPAGGGASPAYEELYRRRHKRNKVKHKKKHKEERKHKEISEDSEMNEDSNGNKCAGAAVISDSSLNYKDMKELCLKQKLSINLKRLNTNAYKRCEDPESNGSKSPTGSEMSDDHGETVPDFPPPSSYLDIRETVDTCVTSDGRLMTIGDVVWGKILGFPWWPGKVSCITVARTEDGQTVDHEAHVRWYGSSTMSLMPCNQLYPFLETFKMRYNKKKRGPYKEAIRQATYEAQRDDSNQEEIVHIESSKAESPPQVIDVVL